MKIRTGFVSNSSSSSFLIYGVCLGQNAEDLDKDDFDFDDLSEKAERLGLTAEIPPSEYVYVGASWSSIKDDETGLQFKQRVNRLIAELLGKEYECSTHEEAWSD